MVAAGVVGAILAVLISGALGPSPGGTGPPPVTKMDWRTVVTLAPATASSPLAPGTPVVPGAEHGAHLARSCSGSTCWAIASIAGTAYPVVSTDQGRTWLIGGPVLHGAGSTSPVGALSLRVLPNGVVAAFGAGSPFFLTTDHGHSWSESTQLGDVNNVVADSGITAPSALALRLITTSPYADTDVRAYDTSDGTSWVLQPRTLRAVVPSVVGLYVAGAVVKLSAAGFVADEVVPEGTTIPVTVLPIRSQDPPAGTALRLGSSVRLTFSLPGHFGR